MDISFICLAIRYCREGSGILRVKQCAAAEKKNREKP
jgi:hypothetical protein